MGICLQMICKMSYVPLNAENCLQNVRKINPTFNVVFFLHLDGKKCLHKLNSSVLYCIFFKLVCTKVRRALVITLVLGWVLASHLKANVKVFFLNFHISTTTGLKYLILEI